MQTEPLPQMAGAAISPLLDPRLVGLYAPCSIVEKGGPVWLARSLPDGSSGWRDCAKSRDPGTDAMSRQRADGTWLMQHQISVITLGVGELSRSRRFYGDGFGW